MESGRCQTTYKGGKIFSEFIKNNVVNKPFILRVRHIYDSKMDRLNYSYVN